MPLVPVTHQSWLFSAPLELPLQPRLQNGRFDSLRRRDTGVVLPPLDVLGSRRGDAGGARLALHPHRVIARVDVERRPRDVPSVVGEQVCGRRTDIVRVDRTA